MSVFSLGSFNECLIDLLIKNLNEAVLFFYAMQI